MRLAYDPETDMAYLRLSDAPGAAEAVARSETLAAPHGEVVLDFDGEGRLVGIEVTGARALLPRDLLPPEPG